jgi:prevent-host-death family protein
MLIMKTANVTYLRTHLSRLLDAVRRGESIEIRDRSIPIARLVPVEPGTKARDREIPPWLERLRRAGVVKVGSLKPVSEILKKDPPGPRRTGALDALIDERRTGR